MSITNLAKPNAGQNATELLIGSGFKLAIGSSYNLTINPLILGSFANLDKVSFGETWGHVATTWATETRTWDQTQSIVSNKAKPSTPTITNQSKPI